MNYFEVQRRLNRQTRYLYFLFFLMIMVAVLGTNLVVARYNIVLDNHGDLALAKMQGFRWFSSLSLWCSGGVLLVILGNYLYTRLNTNNGATIAQNLGGIDVTGNVSSPYFRILNHVVDEMAIAAGIPAPRIFVIEGQNDINAFAAGFSTTDAVIAVTEGALLQLTRSELQALVAHEMSHVVNQDMRFNMDVIAVLAGFMGLTALGFQLIRLLTYSNYSDRKKDIRIILVGMVIGAAFIVLGYFLYILGKIIQSKISFKREYFADSHAVSALRQARPMMSLLAKLRKKNMLDGRNGRNDKEFALIRPEYQHFLFNSERSYFIFKTHPPLNKRIQAIMKFMVDAEKHANVSEKTIAELVREQTSVVHETNKQSLDNLPGFKEKIGTVMGLGIMGVMEGSATIQEKNYANNSEHNSLGDEKSALQTAAEVYSSIPETLQAYIRNKEKIAFIYYAFFLAEEGPRRNLQKELFDRVYLGEIACVKRLIDNSDIQYTYVIAELTFPIFHQITVSECFSVIETLERMMKYLNVSLTQYCLYFSLKKMINTRRDDPRAFLVRKESYITLENSLEAVYFLFSIVAQKASSYTNETIRDEHFIDAIRILYPESTRSLLVLGDDWLDKLHDALMRIDKMDAESKTRLMNTLLVFIKLDRQVTHGEYELIRFISLCIDYPLPLNLEAI